MYQKGETESNTIILGDFNTPQGCILSPCLFNLYAEHIMRNAGLEETQAGLKIAGRIFSNLRYAAEKAMATHPSTLAWKIPWTEEPGGLQSMGLRRVRND